MAKKDKKPNALFQVLTDTEKELMEARTNKEKWAAKEKEAETFIRQLKMRMGIDPGDSTPEKTIEDIAGADSSTPKPQGKIYLKMSLPEAIQAYLKSVEEVSTPGQIAQAIIAGGFITKNTKNMGTMVSTQLGRMPEAMRLGGGKWALKEWRK